MFKAQNLPYLIGGASILWSFLYFVLRNKLRRKSTLQKTHKVHSFDYEKISDHKCPHQVDKKQQSQSIEEILKQHYLSIKQHQKEVEEMMVFKNNHIINQPFNYTMKTNGKQLRMILALVISELYCCDCYAQHVNPEKLEKKRFAPIMYKVGGLIECLHCASLIIDDFEDCSIKRRGQLCAYLKFGFDMAINSANLMYFLPMLRLMNQLKYPLQKKQFMEAYIEMMCTEHMGQAEEVLMHQQTSKQVFNQLCPSSQAYFRLVSAKTGALMKGIVQFVALTLLIQKGDNSYQRLISRQEEQKLIQIVQNVAIGFQIADDLLNLEGNSSKSKGLIGQDLFEKKFTLIVHHLRDNEEFMEIFLKQKGNQNRQNLDDDYHLKQGHHQAIARMVDIVNESGVKIKIKQIAQEYIQKALQKVDQLNTHNDKGPFKELIKFIVQRTK